jgi:hypothetical protein
MYEGGAGRDIHTAKWYVTDRARDIIQYIRHRISHSSPLKYSPPRNAVIPVALCPALQLGHFLAKLWKANPTWFTTNAPRAVVLDILNAQILLPQNISLVPLLSYHKVSSAPPPLTVNHSSISCGGSTPSGQKSLSIFLDGRIGEECYMRGYVRLFVLGLAGEMMMESVGYACGLLWTGVDCRGSLWSGLLGEAEWRCGLSDRGVLCELLFVCRHRRSVLC